MNEKNVFCDRVIGIYIGRIGVIGRSSINDYKYVKLPVEIKVGNRYITILWDTCGYIDGLEYVDAILGNIGAADDIHLIEGVAAYQLRNGVAEDIGGEGHGATTLFGGIASVASA